MGNPQSGRKVIAIVTGGISVLIGIFYLILIMFLDARGPMLPPPPEAFGVVVTPCDDFSLEVQQPYAKPYL